MSQTTDASNTVLDRLTKRDIEEGAVALRVNLAGWPQDVPTTEAHVSSFHQATQAASTAFECFSTIRKRNLTDANLTVHGAFAKTAEFGDSMLDDLRSQLQDVRDDKARTEESVLQSMTKVVATPPDEPHAIALQKEIRDYIRALPEAKRKLEVIRLTLAGDRNAVKAVLSAPAFLTGIKPEEITDLQEIVAKEADPERFAKFKQKMAACEYAERALDGVIRFVEQETRHQARKARDQALEKQGRSGPPSPRHQPLPYSESRAD